MNYRWSDILIVGDSFCADRTRKSNWPQVFTTSLTAKPYQEGIDPRGKGFSGASWWSARKNLLEELKISPAKVLIFCHTEPYRIPSDDDFGLNTRSVLEEEIRVPENRKKPSDDFKVAAIGYYEHIISQPYHDWAYQQWFNEIDTIIESHNIEKSIHLFCFQGPYNQHTFKKGVTISIPLITYQKTSIWRIMKDNANHYSTEQNIELGMNLSNIIKNYPGDGSRLNTRLIGT
jgi:hypothetical protein